MLKAILESKIHINIVPKVNTIKENLQIHKKFIYNSLSNPSYLKDLSNEIKNGIISCKLKNNSFLEDEKYENNKNILLNNDIEWWPNNFENE